MEGVLRSWAVPKGPPTTLRQSRLAMHVEDHPLEYGSFEGTIPPGNYGAGTVMVWDQGTYEDITGNAVSAFYAGKMHIRMKGKKLIGEWILVKDRRSEREHWLLIKAGETMPEFTAETDVRSVLTGRSLQQIAEDTDNQWQSREPSPAKAAKKRKRGTKSLTFIEPMRCKPMSHLPDGDEWLYELKLDGYRCEVVKNGSDVQLLSRNEKSLNQRFPEIVAAVSSIPHDSLVIDGEIVTLDPEGHPSFQLLQNSATSARPVYYYAFDLLHVGDKSILQKPLEERRSALEDLLKDAQDPIRLSPELRGSAEEVTAAVTELRLEGVVAKRRSSLYEPGERTGAWCKYRTNKAQEFVIGGYIPGTQGFDALLVGYYEGAKLRYCAKVKNGFVPRDKGALAPVLKRLISTKCPFSNLPETKGGRWGESLTVEKMKECIWVKPKLVCQVAFVEWTSGGHLRHSTFAGMREDKEPGDVFRET
jgi:bifunctional non-homologous end joining protein LigD